MINDSLFSERFGPRMKMGMYRLPTIQEARQAYDDLKLACQITLQTERDLTSILDVGNLFYAVCILDAYLTKKYYPESASSQRTLEERDIVQRIFSDFDSHEWYLSDGGYSRIYMDITAQDGFWIGSQSLEAVKLRWHELMLFNNKTPK